MSDYGPDFSAFSNRTQVLLYWLDEAVLNIAAAKETPEFFISLIGIFLNVFHLIILTRKSMRSISINVLMIGIGFSDLMIMIHGTYMTMLKLMSSDPDWYIHRIPSKEISFPVLPHPATLDFSSTSSH